jgi:hypothetical protein
VAAPGDPRVAGAPDDPPGEVAHGLREERRLAVPGSGDDPDESTLQAAADVLLEARPRDA